MPHIKGNEVKPYKLIRTQQCPQQSQQRTIKQQRQAKNQRVIAVACAVLRRCPTDAASRQTKHASIGCRQADQDLQADNSYNFCTASIILCLDQISSHKQDSTEELTCHRYQAHRTHNRAAPTSCKALKQHPLRKEASRDKGLPKVQRSLQTRGVPTSPEVLSLSLNCPTTDADVDLQQH